MNKAGSKELLVEGYLVTIAARKIFISKMEVSFTPGAISFMKNAIQTLGWCVNRGRTICVPDYILDRYGRKTTLIWSQVGAYDDSYPIDSFRLTKVIDEASGHWIEMTDGSNEPGHWQDQAM